MNDDKQIVETIGITPKLVDLYPVYAYWIDYGTSNQKNLVKEELLKLCKVADDLAKEETFQYHISRLNEMLEEALLKLCKVADDLAKEETFQCHISCLNEMLEEAKKDIDEISKKATSDDDRLYVGKMIDSWEKAYQATKKMDEEIYVLGSFINDGI